MTGAPGLFVGSLPEPVIEALAPGRAVGGSGMRDIAGLEAQARAAEARGGVLAEHAMSLQKLATERSACIAIRAVNTLAAPLIREGCGTKDMAISGKSSVIPPLCGLIPLDQRYGRAGTAADKAAPLTAGNRRAIDSRQAMAVPLSLSVSHLRQMAGLDIEGTWIGSGQEGNGGIMRGRAGGGEFVFWGEILPDGKVAVYEARKDGDTYGKGDRIEIMANRKGLMVTADYDLAFVAPRVETAGPDHTRPLVLGTFADVQALTGVKEDTLVELLPGDRALKGLPVDENGRVPARVLFDWRAEAAQESTEEPYRRDPNLDGDRGDPPRRGLGNISPYIRRLLPQLNEACGAPEGSGRELFHHSDDAGNPFSVEANNYPITLILPDHPDLPTDGPRILLIEDRAALRQAIQTLKDGHFMPGTTHAWGREVADVRARAFTEARDRLQSLLETRQREGGAPVPLLVLKA